MTRTQKTGKRNQIGSLGILISIALVLAVGCAPSRVAPEARVPTRHTFTTDVGFRGLLGFYENLDSSQTVLVPNLTEPTKLRVRTTYGGMHPHGARLLYRGTASWFKGNQPDTHPPATPNLSICNDPRKWSAVDIHDTQLQIGKPGEPVDVKDVKFRSVASLVAGLEGSPQDKRLARETMNEEYTSSYDPQLLASRIHLHGAKLLGEYLACTHWMRFLSAPSEKQLSRVYFRKVMTEGAQLEIILWPLNEKKNHPLNTRTLKLTETAGRTVEVIVENNPLPPHCYTEAKDFVAHYNILTTPGMLGFRLPHPMSGGDCVYGPISDAQCSPAQYKP